MWEVGLRYSGLMVNFRIEYQRTRTMSSGVQECCLVPVTRANLDDLVELAKDPYFGMPRSRRWFERLLYNDFVHKADENGVRGFLVQNSSGEYVGMVTFSPCHVYVGQEKKIAYLGAILGVKKKYWESLFDLFAALEKDHPNSFAFGNCGASKAAAKVCRACRGDKPGPEDGCYAFRRTFKVARLLNRVSSALCKMKCFSGRPRIHKLIHGAVDMSWWALKPFSVLGAVFAVDKYKFRIETAKVIDHQLFEVFWARYLEQNTGLISSRHPSILEHRFADSLYAGKLVLLCARDNMGSLLGYVFARKYGMSFKTMSPTYRYKIVDVCALNDDVAVLSELVGRLVSYAHSRGAGVVEYIGANPRLEEWLMPHLTEKIALGHPTFSYYCPKSEPKIEEALDQRHGWFFGPFDGERCFGHGGYIDM